MKTIRRREKKKNVKIRLDENQSETTNTVEWI